MRLLKFKRNRLTLSKMLISYMIPLLEYASTAWDSSNQTNNIRLERVQRQAARFCKNNYKREEGTEGIKIDS